MNQQILELLGMGWSVTEPDRLWWLAGGLLVAAGWFWLRGLDRLRRSVVVGLRLLLIGVLVLLLAGLLRERPVDEMRVVVLLDRSESAMRFFQPPVAGMSAGAGAGGDSAQTPSPRANALTGGEAYLAWVRSLLRSASDRQPDNDRLGLVAFAGESSVLSLPSLDGVFDIPEQVNLGRGTDPAEAVRRGLMLMTPDAGGRMVLFWDGRQTMDAGALEEAAAAAAAQGVRVDVVPLEYRRDREVLVHRLVAPTDSVAGRSVWVRAVLRATEPVEGHLRLLHNGVPVRLAGEGPESLGVRVGLDDWAGDGRATDPVYTAAVGIPVSLDEPQLHQFEAVFTPLAERQAEGWSGHRRTAFSLAQGRGRMLVLHQGDAAGIDPLVRAVRRAGVQVEVRPPSGLPGSLRQLRPFDLVVMSNISADLVTLSQQRMLMMFVQDIGGGLLLIGGDRSFGAGGWTDTPLAEIFPVDNQIPDVTVLPAAALALVIDNSGSMGMTVPGTRRTQQQVANDAAVLALDTLLPQDHVGVVAFNHEMERIVPMRPGQDMRQVASGIRSIRPGGGTRIGAGLDEALRMMRRLPPEVEVRHVIMLSDGVSLDPPGGWDPLIQQFVEEGITVSTIGVGGAVDHLLLDRIAEETGGIYHFVRDARHLPQIFVREARTIRRTLVRDVEFTPRAADRSPLVEALGPVPPLRGLVLTGIRQDPRVVNAWLGPDEAPLLAYWQSGLGRVAAFTSDASSRWAADWLAWPGFESFWRNLVDATSRPSGESALELDASLRGRTLRVRMEHFPTDDEPADLTRRLSAQANVSLPGGQTAALPMRQVGPGIFEGEMEAPEDGDYLISASVQSEDGSYRGMVFGVASRPVDAEFEHFTSDRAAVERVAQLTGGRVLEAGAFDAATWFDREGFEPIPARRPIQWSLLVLALVLWWSDIAARRIAWSGPDLLARVTGGGGIRKQYEGEVGRTLGELKKHAGSTIRFEPGQGTEPAADRPGGVDPGSESGRIAGRGSGSGGDQAGAEPGGVSGDVARAVPGEPPGAGGRRGSGSGSGTGDPRADEAIPSPSSEPGRRSTNLLAERKRQGR